MIRFGAPVISRWERGKRCDEARQLVAKFVERLETVPDGCAEVFPLALVKGLREEYY